MWCLHRMEENSNLDSPCGPPNGLPLRPGSWDGCTLRWEGLLLLLLLVLVPKLPKNDGQELSCLGWYLGWQKPVVFAMFLWAFCHISKGPGSSIRKFIYQRFSDHRLEGTCTAFQNHVLVAFQPLLRCFFFVSECHPFVSEFSVRGGLRNNSLGLTIHGILKPFFKKNHRFVPKNLGPFQWGWSSEMMGEFWTAGFQNFSAKSLLCPFLEPFSPLLSLFELKGSWTLNKHGFMYSSSHKPPIVVTFQQEPLSVSMFMGGRV